MTFSCTSFPNTWGFYQSQLILPTPWCYILVAIVAQMFGATMNVLTQVIELTPPAPHPFQLLFIRMGLTVVFIFLQQKLRNPESALLGDPSIRWLLIIRGLAGFMGIFGMYMSLLTLPLSVATVMPFLAPIMVLYGERIIFKAEVPFVVYIPGVVSIVAIVLTVTQSGGSPSPRDDEHQHLPGVSILKVIRGVCFGIFGALGVSIGFLTMKSIGDRANAVVIVLYASLASAVTALVVLVATPYLSLLPVLSWSTFILIIASAVCGFVFQYLLTWSISNEGKQGIAAHMMYTQILFALFYDKVIWGSTPTPLALLGCALIATSALCIVLISRTLDLPSTDRGSASETDHVDTGGGFSGEAETLLEDQPQ